MVNDGILMTSFISSNTHDCIEINGHILINIARNIRECPEYCKIHLKSSQPCESYFRRLRSMSFCFSTIINLDVYECLHKSKRSQELLDTIHSADNDVIYPRLAKEKDDTIHEQLPSDKEISKIVYQAFHDVQETLISLGTLKAYILFHKFYFIIYF